MIICDTHCDTLYMRALEPGKIPCVTMENMVRGGMNLQTCTLFAGSKGMSDHPYEKAMAEYAVFERLAKEEGWQKVSSPLEAEEGKVKILLSVEGGEIFEGNPDRVREFHNLGIRMAAIIWNNENVIEFQTALAAESEDGPERNDLTREKVRIMKDSWIGPTARQIPRIPENPVREEFIKMPGYAEILSNHRFLPVGYNYEDADVYAFDLAKNYMFLVTGAKGTGKSVFMKNLILTCLDREGECIGNAGNN